MNKYIEAEKLISEIERLKELHKGLLSGKFRSGYNSAFQQVLSFITSLQQEQPSLPSNLDEAARKYVTPPNALGIRTFKAGAEWMARQGVNLKCWIARDECSGDESDLYIGQQKPRRVPGAATGFGMWCDYGEFMALPTDMFPELTYSDEPIEVELIIRKK